MNSWALAACAAATISSWLAPGLAEGGRAPGAGQTPGVRSLLDIRRLVEEGEGPLSTRQVELEGRRLPADRPERLVELGEVAHHHQQLTQSQQSGPDVADADQEDGRRASRRDQPYQHVVAALEAGHAHARSHAFSRAAGETPPPPRPLAQSPDDSQRAPRLLPDPQR